MEDHTDLRPADYCDAILTEKLREIYAPPAEAAYLEALDGRVMSNIA